MAEGSTDGSAPLVRLVAELLAQLEGTAVTECEFRAEGRHVLLRRSPGHVAAPQAPGEEAAAIPDHWRAIAAPLAGIFYLAENPKSPPFVRIDVPVAQGQVVGLIESMKMFNPVESDLDGIVRSIAAGNAALVEKGQVLMYVEPRGELP